MAREFVTSKYPTEQQQNVKLDQKAYGKRASALNARPATEQGNPENEGEYRVGGAMFRNTPHEYSGKEEAPRKTNRRTKKAK